VRGSKRPSRHNTPLSEAPEQLLTDLIEHNEDSDTPMTGSEEEIPVVDELGLLPDYTVLETSASPSPTVLSTIQLPSAHQLLAPTKPPLAQAKPATATTKWQAISRNRNSTKTARGVPGRASWSSTQRTRIALLQA
jgi:hypothetical protein